MNLIFALFSVEYARCNMSKLSQFIRFVFHRTGLHFCTGGIVRLDHGALQGLYLTRFIGIHPVGGHECHKVGRPNTFI